MPVDPGWLEQFGGTAVLVCALLGAVAALWKHSLELGKELRELTRQHIETASSVAAALTAMREALERRRDGGA